jgi:flagella basal body P-ring formation protein FlgA
VEFVGANTEVRITAAIRALPGEELVTCGHKYLAEQLARPGVRVEIQDPATPAALAVPDGSVELKASTTAKKASGVVSVSVEGWVDGSRQTRTLLSYRVSSRGVVTQTTHGLESGAVISESDLEDVERDFAEVPRDAVTGRDSLIGMRVVLPVEAGSVVRRGAVALPALVKKGSPVTLVARVGKVEARTMAQARENGTHGEVITVVNLASKRMIKAKVVGEEVVEALMP